jgi:hypothetical protein
VLAYSGQEELARLVKVGQQSKHDLIWHHTQQMHEATLDPLYIAQLLVLLLWQYHLLHLSQLWERRVAQVLDLRILLLDLLAFLGAALLVLRGCDWFDLSICQVFILLVRHDLLVIREALVVINNWHRKCQVIDVVHGGIVHVVSSSLAVVDQRRGDKRSEAMVHRGSAIIGVTLRLGLDAPGRWFRLDDGLFVFTCLFG